MAPSLEVRGLMAYLDATVEWRATPHGIYRPGAITTAGHASRHSMEGTDGDSLALDAAGRRPGRDTPELLAIFNAFRRVEALLHELIYAGPGVTYNIKNGRRVRPYAQTDHHDHVHSSVDLGVIITSPAPPVLEDDMPPINPKAVVDDQHCYAPGCPGWFELEADGGVTSQGQHTGDHFAGSYFDTDLADLRANNPGRVFLAITPRRDLLSGYTLWANDGAYVDRPR
jgi:hypothetical protein